jgi:hypothetical protein
MDSDLEDRVRTLERLVVQLGQMVHSQHDEIALLRGELSGVITDQAIASLTSWPTMRTPR